MHICIKENCILSKLIIGQTSARAPRRHFEVLMLVSSRAKYFYRLRITYSFAISFHHRCQSSFESLTDHIVSFN